MKIHVDPLLPLFLCPAILMGHGRAVAAAVGAVLVHEIGHILTAAVTKTRIYALTLAPFGAAGEFAPTQKTCFSLAIALAGPVFSLAAAYLCSKLGWMDWARMHAAMGLINLIPVYPLDGGHVLCACVTPLFGSERAVYLCTLGGYCAGFLLLAAGTALFAAVGVINLSFVFLGCMMISMAGARRKRTLLGALKNDLKKRRRMSKRPMPSVNIAVEGAAQAGDVVAELPKTGYAMITVMDKRHNPLFTVSETRLLQEIMAKGLHVQMKNILDQRREKSV